MKYESKHLARAIGMMENGPYASTTMYRKFRRNLIVNGYFIVDKIYKVEEDTYCWLIWKETDISKDPQWKGEPLLKVIPKFTLRTEMEIKQCLDLQGWAYL